MVVGMFSEPSNIGTTSSDSLNDYYDRVYYGIQAQKISQPISQPKPVKISGTITVKKLRRIGDRPKNSKIDSLPADLKKIAEDALDKKLGLVVEDTAREWVSNATKEQQKDPSFEPDPIIPSRRDEIYAPQGRITEHTVRLIPDRRYMRWDRMYPNDKYIAFRLAEGQHEREYESMIISEKQKLEYEYGIPFLIKRKARLV